MKIKIVLFASATALFYASTAMAQADEPSVGIEDIVVTAQKRDQRLQDVPVSVTAIGGDALQDRGISDLTQIAVAVPGVQITPQNGVMLPFLRGIGNASNAVGNESSVAIYTDGVYFTRLPVGFFSLANVERVEVIKGPQGTLFGRNSSGGVIHIVTKDPSYPPILSGTLSYANYETLEGALYASAGLSEKIAMDISVNGRRQGEGWGTNTPTGNRAGFNDNFLARSKVLLEPTETFKLTVTGFYGYTKSGTGGNVFPGKNQGFNTPPFQQLGPLPDFYGQRNDIDQYAISNSWGGSLRGDLDLGFANLTSISAHSQMKERTLFDADSTPRPDFTFFLASTTAQFTQEFQLGSEAGDRLNWLVGLFYYDAVSKYTRIVGSGAPFGGLSLIGDSRVHAKSYAAYGQASYEVVPQLNLTAGLRYTRDEIAGSGRGELNTTPPIPAIPFQSARDAIEKVTFRIAADYKVTDDVMAYGSFSRGYKAATYNLLFFNPVPTKPEVIDAYEIGLKTDLLDKRVRFNSSLFLYDISNPQVQLANAGNITLSNARSARVKGAEVDIVAAMTGGLEARLAATYLDSKYKSYLNAPSGPENLLPPFGSANPLISIDASGRRLPLSSKFTMNAGATYKFESPIGSWAASIDYYYNQGYNFEPDNLLHQPNFGLLDVQLKYSPTERFDIRLWGRNLTDKQYVVQANTAAGPSGYPYNPGAPRTYGVSVDFRF